MTSNLQHRCDLIPQLNKFPRDQRFVLGGIFETKVLDVHECRQPAYYNRDKRGQLLEASRNCKRCVAELIPRGGRGGNWPESLRRIPRRRQDGTEKRGLFDYENEQFSCGV